MLRKKWKRKVISLALIGSLCISFTIPVSASGEKLPEETLEEKQPEGEILEEEQPEGETLKEEQPEGETLEEEQPEGETLKEEQPEGESLEEEQLNTDSKAPESRNANSFEIDGTVLRKYIGTGGAVIIPDYITEIAWSAFGDCVNLTSVKLGRNVEIIGASAFKNCINLETIEWNDKISQIKEYAFSGTALTELVLPDTVFYIGSNAFWNCDSMRTAIVGKGLIAVPDGMFSGCTLLKKVTINGMPTRFAERAFWQCSSLIDINIPDSVTRIGEQCFYGCKKLEILKLGNGITTINRQAFGYCTKLTTLYMSYSLEGWGDDLTWGARGVTAYIYSDSVNGIKWAKEQGVRYKLIGNFKPDAVTGLKAVPYGKNKVLLTWDSVYRAEGYLLYAQKKGQYGYLGMSTPGWAFIDSKALDEEYNFYWVFPYITDSKGKIIPGVASQYVYAKGIIPPVSNLKGASMIGGVKVSWTRRSDADGYLIYGIRNGQKYSYIGMTNETAFIDKKASKAGYNFYWVFPFHYSKSGKMVVGEITPRYVYGKAN